MIKIIYKFIFLILTLLILKIVLDIKPISPSRYYDTNYFYNMVDKIKNGDKEEYMNLVLYFSRNYDKKEEKIYNLKLLRCYKNKYQWDVLNNYFEQSGMLGKFDIKECPKEPLKLLDGHFSIWKYLWNSFLYNRFSEG